VTIDSFRLDYRSTIRFRLGVDDDAAHVGGLTIFGKSFGNYGQNIKVNLHYAPMESEQK
jgi:predicted transcriptional regulator